MPILANCKVQRVSFKIELVQFMYSERATKNLNLKKIFQFYVTGRFIQGFLRPNHIIFLTMPILANCKVQMVSFKIELVKFMYSEKATKNLNLNKSSNLI